MHEPIKVAVMCGAKLRQPGCVRGSWPIAIPVALMVVVAFAPALNNGFVNWDDKSNFLDNPHYRGLGPAELRWAWTTFWLGVYQPLAWSLFGAEYVTFRLDPHGYHLVSLTLHAVNMIVLYFLTKTLLGRCRPDACAGSDWPCAWGRRLPLRFSPSTRFASR